MKDKTKPGELMPDEILDQLEHAFSMTGRLDGVMLKLTEEQYEYIKNLVRAKQSPPVQSDAELQSAIEWMREKHKAGELPHGATWYLNKIIEAAEQRVAGQVEVLISALEEIREIYVGSEGFIAETAPEAYLQQEFRKQYDVAVKALAISGKEE